MRNKSGRKRDLLLSRLKIQLTSVAEGEEKRDAES